MSAAKGNNRGGLRKGAGRPAKPDNEKLSQGLHLRLDIETERRLANIATRQGKETTGLIREIITEWLAEYDKPIIL